MAALVVTVSPANDHGDATYASDFQHANEHAEAGYYRVQLDSGAVAELSATTRQTLASRRKREREAAPA